MTSESFTSETKQWLVHVVANLRQCTPLPIHAVVDLLPHASVDRAKLIYEHIRMTAKQCDMIGPYSLDSHIIESTHNSLKYSHGRCGTPRSIPACRQNIVSLLSSILHALSFPTLCLKMSFTIACRHWRRTWCIG